MNLKDFLTDNPIINKAQLAKDMWGISTSSQKLNNKLSEVENAKGSKQRITEKDEQEAKNVLKKLSDNIIKYIES